MELINKLFCIYYIIVVYIVSLKYVILQLFGHHRKPKIKSQHNRVALITGGGRGIGYESATQLLQADMTVIIAGIEKDQKEGVEELLRQFKERVIFLECDLSSLESVRQMVKKFKGLKIPLHLLINNAGIMFAPRIETQEGFESQFIVNYLSHFLLTHMLLPSLAKSSCSSAPSRIVNLGSCLHYPGTISFKDIHGKKFYSAEAAYMQSKLAMVMFACSLARRLKSEGSSVLINSVHPAVAFSGLYKYVWWADLALGKLAKLILNTPAMGADTVLHAAVSEEVVDGGNYFENCLVTQPSKEARSVLHQEALWQLSCDAAGIEEFGRPQ